MKRYLTLIIILVLILSLSDAQAQKKRFLMEQIVNCDLSFSPLFDHLADSLNQVYGGDVLIASLHYPDGIPWTRSEHDSMGIHEARYFNFTFGKYYNLLNRSKINGEWPSMWKQVESIPELLNEKAKASVFVEWSIDEENDYILTTVNVLMHETVDKPLSFNAYVPEDTVIGEGPGWDQVNGLSGNVIYKYTKYYEMPDTIVGFVHNNVVRVMLGGISGVRGEFPVPAQAGKLYTHHFKCKIDPKWDTEQLKVIGFVNVDSSGMKPNYEILNCAKGNKVSAKFSVGSEKPYDFVAPEGDTFEKIFTVKNTSGSEMTFQISVAKSDRTPDDWAAGIEGNNEITLSPDESKDVILKLIHGSTISIGDAILTIKEKNNPNSYIWTEKISVYSQEIEKLNVTDEYSLNDFSLTPMLNEIGNNEYFEITPEFFLEHGAEFPELKTLIWNSGYYVGILDSIEIQKIKEASERGVNIFQCNNRYSFINIGHYDYSDFFGIDFLCYSTISDVSFTGYNDDPISGFLSEDNALIDDIIWLSRICKILDDKNVKPILRLNTYSEGEFLGDDGEYYTRILVPDSAIFGVRIEKNSSRMVFMARSPYTFASRDTAKILVKNILNWLDGLSDNVEDYEAHSGDFYLDVAPNPVMNNAKIRYAYDGIMPKTIELSMFDLTGSKITTLYKEHINPGEHVIELDTGNLAAGSYRVVLKSQGEVASCSVVVVK